MKYIYSHAKYKEYKKSISVELVTKVLEVIRPATKL